MNDPYIYLLASEEEYEESLASGLIIRDSLNDEGFIHASPKNQLTRVANKHYNHLNKLLVLVVDCSKVKPEIKWEPAAGSLYPHIFGPLNTDSIVNTMEFSKNNNSQYDIHFN